MCEELSDNPLYLATARRWDEEFVKRIECHQADRGDRWSSIEEEKSCRTPLEGRTVMMDCVTLWLTNIFHDNDYDLQRSLDEAKAEWTIC